MRHKVNIKLRELRDDVWDIPFGKNPKGLIILKGKVGVAFLQATLRYHTDKYCLKLNNRDCQNSIRQKVYQKQQILL